MVGTYDRTTGLFTLDTTDTAGETCYYLFVPNDNSTISLSDYFTTGKYYIKVGYGTNQVNGIQYTYDKPLYYFDGTNLVDGHDSFLCMTTAEFEQLMTKHGYYFVY